MKVKIDIRFEIDDISKKTDPRDLAELVLEKIEGSDFARSLWKLGTYHDVRILKAKSG